MKRFGLACLFGMLVFACENHRLAQSINDASWRLFREWVEYFGRVYGVKTIAVPPHNTSQNCSDCGKKVCKSLSTRTHQCPHCGYVADRDENAARNILAIGLRTVGHTGTYASGEYDLCLTEAILLSKLAQGKRKPKERSLESPRL